MNDRFSENEFRQADIDKSFFIAYHCFIGKYLIRLWAGPSAASKPKKQMPSVSDYTHFEVELYTSEAIGTAGIAIDGEPYFSVHPDEFGIEWSECGFTGTRGLDQPIATIRALMAEINKRESSCGKFPSEKSEGPCKNCSRLNDIGVAECWWCGCFNPC